MARIEQTVSPLGESDLHIVKEFIRQACLKHEGNIWDFYENKEGLDMSTGIHSWKAKEVPDGTYGYMVCKQGKGAFESTSVFPFVTPSKLGVGLPTNRWVPLLDELLEEPLHAGSFYIYYKKRKLAFLTKTLHEAEKNKVRLEGVIPITRKEAFAILNGEVLDVTKEKLIALFEIKE